MLPPRYPWVPSANISPFGPVVWPAIGNIYTYVPVHLSIYLYQITCLFVYLSICLSYYLIICLSIYLLDYLSICLFVSV